MPDRNNIWFENIFNSSEALKKNLSDRDKLLSSFDSDQFDHSALETMTDEGKLQNLQYYFCRCFTIY